jgi:uncharacterized protein (DUF1501 family)
VTKPFKKKRIMKTRRQFFGEASCAAISSVSTLNMMLNLQMASSAAAQSSPAGGGKTLVCVFLAGGIDSFNWLVPTDARYSTYSTTRGNLALPTSGGGSLLPLNQAAGGDGQGYGIHPSCSGLQQLFNGIGGDTTKRRLSFLTNIGTLIVPTNKAQYLAESVPLPRALYSHSDQIDQWQTSVPQGLTIATGWAGRAADLLHSTVNGVQNSMNISFSGNNLFQVGNMTQQFVATYGGALTLTESQISNPGNANVFVQKNLAHRSMIEQSYANIMQQSYSRLTKTSLDEQQTFKDQFNAFNDGAIAPLFGSSGEYGRTMLAVANSIAIRNQLGLNRQTLFVQFGGWDHHGELLGAQAGMLNGLSSALFAFQQAMETLGLADSVITFTASDFGRTLRSNGRGTDHAWGGNQIVMGGPVQGGRIVGTFPNLALESSDDMGYGGRLCPTTSVDQHFAEMLRWFGVSGSGLTTVLPNIGNFYSPSSTTLPLGYLKPGTWS